jgi:hypothetical protein
MGPPFLETRARYWLGSHTEQIFQLAPLPRQLKAMSYSAFSFLPLPPPSQTSGGAQTCASQWKESTLLLPPFQGLSLPFLCLDLTGEESRGGCGDKGLLPGLVTPRFCS